MIVRRRMAGKMIGCVVVLGAIWVGMISSTEAQTSPSPEPLQCWWRTSVGAVRVGEIFSLALTCSVLDTPSIKAVPDQSQLDPRTLQLPPFDLLGGNQASEVRTSERRFLQYEYNLRLINDAFIGKDIRLPEVKIAYHIQNNAGQGESVEGREDLYALAPISIRVLSLAPADATDIREAAGDSISSIEERSFHASTLLFLGGTAFSFAAIAFIAGLVQLRNRHRARQPEKQNLVSDSTILANLESELSLIQEKRGSSGWTPDLVARTLAACRIAGNYALSRPISQFKIEGEPLKLNSGGFVVTARRNQQVFISGSVTGNDISHAMMNVSVNGAALHRKMLEELSKGLNEFTKAQYGREPSIEQLQLDSSFARVMDAVAELRARNRWWRKNATTFRLRTAELGQRVWSH